MEEEIICSSLTDSTDSVLQQPQHDSWTSIEHQYINGEQEAIVWGETEVQTNQAHGTDQLNLTLKAGQETPEEAEQWEQIIWTVRPMTCTSAPLSFATVQWDMPGPFTETPSLTIDSSSANELDSVTSGEATFPSLQHSEEDSVQLLTEEEREERDGFDSRLLNSSREGTGNGSEPCDTVDVQEPATQEEEDSRSLLVLGDNGTDSEEEEGRSLTLNPVETLDIIGALEETESSEGNVGGPGGLKLDEEEEEAGSLLTEPEETEETSATVAEIEEDNEEGGEEEEEEQNVTNVPCSKESEDAKTVSCLSDVEDSTELLPADDTGLNLVVDKLIVLQQSEESLQESRRSGREEDVEILEQLHEDPAGGTEEPEMRKDVEHGTDTEKSEAAHEEASIQEAENAERVDDSRDVLEETSCLEQQDCDRTTSQESEASQQPDRSGSEQLEMNLEPEQIQAEVSHQIEEPHSDQFGQSPEMELREEPNRPENAEQTESSTLSEQAGQVDAVQPEAAEQLEPTAQKDQSPQTTNSSQPTLGERPEQPLNSDESELTEQPSPGAEVTQQAAEAEPDQVGTRAEALNHVSEEERSEDGDAQTVTANGEQPKPPETAAPHMNGGDVGRETARRLAERLYELDGIQRVDVVKHLDKDNDFSRAVGEEYLRFFDFSGQTLDHALRSFLKVVVLIGESQERERVLQHFACRFHQCNPDSFSTSGAALALTCALMLLNTDLHGQHVGKSMSSSRFVSNLDGMNEGENFSKDLLKSLYNSIKGEPLEWAVDEEELKSSVLPDEDAGEDAPLRSKANPFQDVPHDRKAAVVKEGFLQRKLHADIDGKRTPWGKRGWKTFNGVLKGMVLYLQKNDYRRDQQTSEEVVSVHHSLAEQAADYTKKPYVFRLQTADWRVFLFQASSKAEMNSWISRINLVSALHSSPPFPAAVGSQRKFFRPILPASQSAHTRERQLQSHSGMLESFKADLSYLEQNPPEGRKARAKELEEHRVRAEYLQYEICRYEIYIQVLEGWTRVEKTESDVLSSADLNLFDKAVCRNSAVGEEEEEEGGLKKSYSSPSLELEIAPPTVVKVKRNISERRTYRRTIIPRWNKET